jgi:hypothetical protein
MTESRLAPNRLTRCAPFSVAMPTATAAKLSPLNPSRSRAINESIASSPTIPLARLEKLELPTRCCEGS